MVRETHQPARRPASLQWADEEKKVWPPRICSSLTHNNNNNNSWQRDIGQLFSPFFFPPFQLAFSSFLFLIFRDDAPSQSYTVKTLPVSLSIEILPRRACARDTSPKVHWTRDCTTRVTDARALDRLTTDQGTVRNGNNPHIDRCDTGHFRSSRLRKFRCIAESTPRAGDNW